MNLTHLNLTHDQVGRLVRTLEIAVQHWADVEFGSDYDTISVTMSLTPNMVSAARIFVSALPSDPRGDAPGATVEIR